MDILVGINSGRIEFRRARREGSTFFDTEAEAASVLAHHKAQMARRVEYAPSCHSPEANGRPGFSLHAFKRLVDIEVGKFGTAVVGTLAA